MKFFKIVLFALTCTFITSYAAYDCALGLWGSQCSNDCGNCEGGKAFCQVTNGLCVNGCARGYQGRDCKTPCPPGTHGQYCVYKCGSCSDVRPVCDPVSGMCQAGCKTGFQKPHCKLACPFYTWGDDCSNNCSCKKPPIECSCHPETGQCEPCGPNQKSLRFSMPVNNPECLNQFALDEAVKFYTPPSVLNIPWKPVAAIFLLLILFIFTYYIYWWKYIRQVPIDEETKEIAREKKRQRIRQKQLRFYAKHAKENMAKYRTADWENKPPVERESYEQIYF
ncbi:multiple epidermal growth factor-like domains protein 10 [Biomphalaria glabrata]|uniref:Multiple epidermal growth factor-like domains protein 10 n=1 Tax=Biomphalaria glabrata TaxID=6526 RepID=A0A9W2Z9R3_BIOGL|nr:multiple epidermal growth factor-like domains protein 10 [Biomphalaria glabrata]KAI8737046.1 multiple epidermal growth factor-like domains 10 protein [Biomphalaria glabrata]